MFCLVDYSLKSTRYVTPHNTRSKCTFMTSRQGTNLKSMCLSVHGVKLWHSLHEDIQNCNSLNVFVARRTSHVVRRTSYGHGHGYGTATATATATATVRLLQSSIVNTRKRRLPYWVCLWSQLQVNCIVDLTRKAAGVYCAPAGVHQLVSQLVSTVHQI